MNNSYPRLMLAAPKSGSGKTMLTCGLLNAFQLRKLSCRSFKCGPDYIDPMFHKQVLGIDGGNLDTFFLDNERVREQFTDQAWEAGISVIEGVMGYYDGVGGDTTHASSYEVACVLDTPVVLILDCKGASLSLAPVVKGFLEYKENSHIKGVILNRTSQLMADRLTPVMEELGVHVYGFFPECEEGAFGSRHLGLVLPGELKGLKDKLQSLAMKLETTIDVDGLLKLAQDVNPLPLSKKILKKLDFPMVRGEEVLIGMALDEAFSFYYQENLKLLEEMGARLIPFSPIRDKRLPSGISGLLLGGGYPELYGRELSENESMLREIRRASEHSLPILAECGGFLYLHEELETKDHETFSMAGIIHGKAVPGSRLQRFGYIEVFSKEDTLFFKKGESIRGHEFHYWESTDNGACMVAIKPGGGKRWECVHGEGNLLAGFPHFYYPSNPVLPKRFVEACRRVRKAEEN